MEEKLKNYVKGLIKARNIVVDNSQQDKILAKIDREIQLCTSDLEEAIKLENTRDTYIIKALWGLGFTNIHIEFTDYGRNIEISAKKHGLTHVLKSSTYKDDKTIIAEMVAGVAPDPSAAAAASELPAQEPEPGVETPDLPRHHRL